jgi:NADH-quinone oxidoreductase subunit J
MYQALFFLFAAAAVGFGINMLIQRHPIYSAISLIGVMASLASLYLMLGAEFLAAVQVIVYAGAIMVLFVFVIMLLNAGEETRTSKSMLAKSLGGPLAIMLLGLLSSLLYRVYPSEAAVRFGDFPGQTADIGRRLYLYYMLPFEVVSILILVAIVGAVVLAKKEF